MTIVLIMIRKSPLFLVADEKYKETVLEKLGTKESPAIFVSDDFSQKELADTENMEKYVVDAIEDSEENFYYHKQYYKKKQDEKECRYLLMSP